MTLTHDHQPDELLSLIADYCDGTIAAAAGARLEALLRDDPRARSLYVEYLELHLALRKHAKRQESEAGTIEVISAQWPVVGPESPDRSASQANAAKLPVAPPPTRPFALPSRSPVLGFLAPITRRIPGGEVTVGGLVVLVLVAAFWGLAQKIMYPNLGSHELAVGTGMRDEGSEIRNGKSETVATILDTDNVEWSPNPSSRIPHPSAITPGQPLSITSGLVELELTQGTKLLIEGPAEWTIDGNNNATLKRGKLVAKVPQQAIGFTLDTPTAKIVDLGTQFGVEFQPQGATQVRVIQGAVETRSAKPGTAPIRLSANQAVQISSDGSAPQVVPFDLAPFARLQKRLSKERPPSPAERVVLFSDNFNAREPRLGISPAELDDADRQGGLLRRLTYTERMLAEDHRPRLDRRGGAADTAARLHARSSRFSPNVNFKMQAQGGVKFIVSVDIAPPVPSENGKLVDQDWAGLIVGCTTQEVAMSQPGGVGFVIHSYGSFFAYDGTGAGQPLHIPGGNIQPRWEPIQVRVEYVTTGFDRGGPVAFEIFLDDVSRMKFQTRAPLLENYLMLEAMWGELPQEGWFDNLMVASEKENTLP